MVDMIKLPAQNMRLYRKEQPYGSNEEDFDVVSSTLNLPVSETAFVLVDCWNMHYSASFERRVAQIDRERIAPALAAARAIGMTVVHAPAPKISVKYPQAKLYSVPGESYFDQKWAEPDPDWPPREFIERTGKYAKFARDYAVPMKYWIGPYENQDIDPAVKPIDSDDVITTQGELQRLLKDKKILHLIYVGFATNMCLLGRDYGVRAMAWLGYNPIVLRDCTTAVEHHDTVDDLWATRVVVHEFEYYWGYSALSEDFIKACKEMGRD